MASGLLACGGTDDDARQASNGGAGAPAAEAASGGAGAASTRVGESGAEAGAGRSGSGGAADAGADAVGSGAGAAGRDDSGNGCSFTMTPVPPATVDASAPLEERATGEQLASLYAWVGRYLNGEVAAYRGRMSAHDNASEVFPGETDGSIPEGPALASLLERDLEDSDFLPTNYGVMGQGAFLALHGVDTDLHVFIEQSDAARDVTRASLLVQSHQSASEDGALSTSCTDCAPRLWAPPPAIVLDAIMTTGTAPSVAAAHTFINADLEALPACAISFDDLLVFGRGTDPALGAYNGLSTFKRVGQEMVGHFYGSLDIADPAPTIGGAGSGPCEFTNPYELDLFVDLNDLSHYGVRNLTFHTPEEECPI